MTIFEQMLEKAGNAGIVEGSFIADHMLAVAAELERVMDAAEYLPNRIFPTLAEGDDLTLVATNFGTERHGAQYASAEITATGTAGTGFTGVQVCTKDGELIYDCEDGVIGNDGTAVVAAVCREAGEKGNAAAGEICDTVTTYDGIYTVKNERAASGGADEESDSHLRERVLSKLRNPGTGGNAADYKNWALSVDGVERVLVTSPAAGKVTVYITASGNAEAGAGLVSRVKAHIEMLRPLGADVTVVSGTAVPVNIAAKITTTEGADREKMTADIEKVFSDYLAECSFKSSTVSYLRIAELLFTESVSDVTGYSLNGGTDSITLEQGTFPVPGQVVIS